MLNGFWRKSFEANNIRFYVNFFFKKSSKQNNQFPSVVPIFIAFSFFTGPLHRRKKCLYLTCSLSFASSMHIYLCLSARCSSFSTSSSLFSFSYRKFDLLSLTVIFSLSFISQRQIPWFANVFASLTKRVKSIIKILTFIHNFFPQLLFSLLHLHMPAPYYGRAQIHFDILHA